MIFAHLIQTTSTLPTDVSALESSISALERDISALESAIKALENPSVPWEWLMSGVTAVVVVGLLMEFWVIWREHRDEWDVFDLGIVRLADKPSRTKLAVEIISVSLITLGVAGEFGIGLEIASINGSLRGKSAQLRSKNAELRSKSNQLLALVTQQAGEAKDNALLAQQSAKAAGIDAVKAKTKADAVAQQAGELQNQLNAVEAKRAELETSLKNLAVCSAPRVITNWTSGGKRYNDALKKFSGWKARVEYVPDDAETRRAASNLVTALRDSQWDVTPVPSTEVFDGVEVQGFDFPSSERPSMSLSNWQIEQRSREVAAAVVIFLHSYNWEAKLGWMMPPDRDRKLIPSDGVLIKVGLYPPMTYVTPPALKGIAASIAEQQKERIKGQETREAERLNKLTPEQAAAYKASTERWKQEEKRLLAPYESPCQPLEPLVPRFVP